MVDEAGIGDAWKDHLDIDTALGCILDRFQQLGIRCKVGCGQVYRQLRFLNRQHVGLVNLEVTIRLAAEYPYQLVTDFWQRREIFAIRYLAFTLRSPGIQKQQLH